MVREVYECLLMVSITEGGQLGLEQNALQQAAITV